MFSRSSGYAVEALTYLAAQPSGKLVGAREMATRLEAARALVYSAAEAYDRGDPGIARRSAMAKLFATETAQQVIDAAIQVHGAVALERGHLLEHLYREVRAPRIYEGTSEIQREIIARDLFR